MSDETKPVDIGGEAVPTDENGITPVVRLPLWARCLEAMREEEQFGFGAVWPVEYFEERLHAKLGEKHFAFEMLELRATLEHEDGYYLEMREGGKQWGIPTALLHEDVCLGFDSRMRRYAHRAVALRSKVLTNPEADLTTEQRQVMERAEEHAAIRLLLVQRSKSVAALVREKNPKLLQRSTRETEAQ